MRTKNNYDIDLVRCKKELNLIKKQAEKLIDILLNGGNSSIINDILSSLDIEKEYLEVHIEDLTKQKEQSKLEPADIKNAFKSIRLELFDSIYGKSVDNVRGIIDLLVDTIVVSNEKDSSIEYRKSSRCRFNDI